MAKIEELPTYPKSTDYVEICRRNGWSLNDLARKLGYEHFGQAHRKINALHSLGQCIQCRRVSHFPNSSHYVCSSECEKKRHTRRMNVLRGRVDEPCCSKGEKMTVYAKRVRAHPLFLAEVKRGGRTKTVV